MEQVVAECSLDSMFWISRVNCGAYPTRTPKGVDFTLVEVPFILDEADIGVSMAGAKLYPALLKNLTFAHLVKKG